MHDSMVMAVCILPATSCTDYSVVTFFKVTVSKYLYILSAETRGGGRRSASQPAGRCLLQQRNPRGWASQSTRSF